MKIGRLWLISLLTSATFIVIASGASLSMHGMMEDRQMTGCPFMSTNVICTMNVQEHITAWQNMFSALPVQTLLFLSLLLVVVRPFFYSLMLRPPGYLYSSNDGRELKIYDPLREAFANGLIHSKAY